MMRGVEGVESFTVGVGRVTTFCFVSFEGVR